MERSDEDEPVSDMRILVVDDDPLMVEPLKERLRQGGHRVVACSDGESAWEALQGGAPFDVVVLDWMMPGMNGLELCRRIRDATEGPYTYVVMLTGRDDPGDVLTGFEAGADDYLVKPFDWAELDARLRVGERIVDLQNALIEARETLRVQAMQDPLTGILNHGAIIDTLKREVDRAHRERRPVSMVLADLDEFKKVNDQHGHLVGDRVLIEVARRMRSCLRSYDSIGRYGGEEFLIVFPNSGPSQASALAERIRSAVSNEPFKVGEVEMTVTISQGVATWPEPTPAGVERLIHCADQALYAVKHSGRDGVECVRFDAGRADELFRHEGR